LKREENPLYRWRKKNRKTRYDVMNKLNVRSATTIYYWELGEITPPSGQLRDLAGMMGVEYGALAESWTGWMQT